MIAVSTPAGLRTRGISRILIGALYLLATFQVVFYYLFHVPCYMNLLRYENGIDRMPFQGRVMMMFLLRWAHHNSLLLAMTAFTAKVTPWFFPHVGPEFFLETIVDVASIAVTGFVATRLYEASSRERLLTPFLYPLVLVFCVATYILHTAQDLRYFYDFPSLAFFSVGIYLIYFRRSPVLFAAIFLVGTINRETTVFLLLFYVLANLVDGNRSEHSIDWRRLRLFRVWGVVVPLAVCWLVWHVWIGWVFRHNPTEFSWRYFLNAGSLLWPPAWPQLFGAGCYLLPVIYLFRGSVKDPTLRIWLWTIPVWFAVMFFYGIWIETRIFGELIPYFACLAALIAERTILARLIGRPWQDGEYIPVVME